MANYFDPLAPYGSAPARDFFKEVQMERLLGRVDVEVLWRLIEVPDHDKPVYAHAFDARTGDLRFTVHAPQCRCPLCPLFGPGKVANLRRRNPFPYLTEVDPNLHYEEASPHDGRGLRFICQCTDCKRHQIAARQKMEAAKDHVRDHMTNDPEIRSCYLDEKAPGHNPDKFSLQYFLRAMVYELVEVIHGRMTFEVTPDLG